MKFVIQAIEAMQSLTAPLEGNSFWGMAWDQWFHLSLPLILYFVLIRFTSRAIVVLFCTILIKEILDLGVFYYYGSASEIAFIDSVQDIAMGVLGLGAAYLTHRLGRFIKKCQVFVRK